MIRVVVIALTTVILTGCITVYPSVNNLPPIVINDQLSGVKAYITEDISHNHTIYISPQSLEDEDVYFNIVGHELGHLFYNNEMKCDNFGMRWAKEQGADPCKMIKLDDISVERQNNIRNKCKTI